MLKFDMLGIDSDSQLPILSLPKLNAVYGEAGEDGNPTIESYTSSIDLSGDTDTAGFVGWLDGNNRFVNSTEAGDGTGNILTGQTQDDLDKYMPIYQLPGSSSV